MILRERSTLFEQLLEGCRSVASCAGEVFGSRVQLLVDQPKRLTLF
jgi:hypothetical protein